MKARALIRRPRPSEVFIQCLICGRRYKALQGHINPIHDVSGPEYKEAYGVRYVVSDALRLARTIWTRQRIIQELGQRMGQGKPVYSAAMKRERRLGSVVMAAREQFGSYEGAVRAAGIEYDGVRQVRPAWTRSEIMQVIRQRAQAGLPLSTSRVRSETGLVKAAVRRFGSYEAALRAAGIDYEKVAKRHRWDGLRVISEIRHRHQEGKALNTRAVAKDNLRLLSQARRRLGSWRRAVGAAGLDYEGIQRQRIWSEAKIVEALKARTALGLPMNFKALRPSDPSLLCAMRTWFGSSENALRAAGIDYDHARLTRRWNRERFLEEVRRRNREGKPLNYVAVREQDRGLLWIGESKFGSWPGAVRAAGLDYEAVSLLRWWNRKKVVQAIRDRARQGKGLNHDTVQRENRSLHAQAMKRFGSWREAVEVAGFDYNKINLNTLRAAGMTAESRRGTSPGQALENASDR